jgi:four helix bundle protein
MTEVRSYRDLQVWQKGIELAAEVHRLTKGFPRDEQFGLTSQLRRAATSVPANIAEGHARKQRREFRRFVCMAMGSLAELDAHFEVALRFGHLGSEQRAALLLKTDELGRMLHGLLRALPLSEPLSQVPSPKPLTPSPQSLAPTP